MQRRPGRARSKHPHETAACRRPRRRRARGRARGSRRRPSEARRHDAGRRRAARPGTAHGRDPADGALGAGRRRHLGHRPRRPRGRPRPGDRGAVDAHARDRCAAAGLLRRRVARRRLRLPPCARRVLLQRRRADGGRPPRPGPRRPHPRGARALAVAARLRARLRRAVRRAPLRRDDREAVAARLGRRRADDRRRARGAARPDGAARPVADVRRGS